MTRSPRGTNVCQLSESRYKVNPSLPQFKKRMLAQAFVNAPETVQSARVFTHF
jgi:hypothetical protein